MPGQQCEAFYLLVAGQLLLKGLYTLGHHFVYFGVGTQLFAALVCYAVLLGVFFKQGVVGYDECRDKLAAVGNDGYLVDELVNQQLRLYHLRRYVLAVRRLEQVFNPFFQEEFAIAYIARVARAEVAFLVERQPVKLLAVVVALGYCRPFEQYFVVLAELYVKPVDGTAHRTHRERPPLVVCRHCGKAFSQAVAHYHADADGMDEFLYLGRHGGSCRREYVGTVKPQLVAHYLEQRAVHQRILHPELQRRPLSAAQVFYVVLPAYRPGPSQQLLLRRRGAVDAVSHLGVDLLPEPRDGAHARRMRLAHGLLYFLRVGVDYYLGSLAYAQEEPCALEDVRHGQEVHHPVVLPYGYYLVVCLQRGAVLAVSQHHALAVAGCPTGVEDVAQVVVAGLGVQLFHLRLARTVVSEGKEIVEVYRRLVGRVYFHPPVENDDALQRMAVREHPPRLVVLLLLAHKEHTYLRVVDYELDLLLAARRVERHGDGPDAERPEVGVKVFNAILREHPHVLLHPDAEVEHGVRHMAHLAREVLPCGRLPLGAAETAVD